LFVLDPPGQAKEMPETRSVAPVGDQCRTALRGPWRAANVAGMIAEFNLAPARVRGGAELVAECGE
jgi:hypothetical protein